MGLLVMNHPPSRVNTFALVNTSKFLFQSTGYLSMTMCFALELAHWLLIVIDILNWTGCTSPANVAKNIIWNLPP